MNERKHTLAHAMGEIDERFLLEAEDALAASAVSKPKKKTVGFLWQSLIAACLLIALILPIALGLATTPTDSLSKYKDHPYYEVIKAIDGYQNLASALTMKYELLYGGTMNPSTGIPDKAPGATDGNEITDNQVEGVFEGDRIKRNNTHVFFLDRNGYLCVYKLNGESVTLVTSFDPTPEESYTSWSTREIYLINDGKTLVTLSPAYDTKKNYQKTRINAYDVSDIDSFDPDKDSIADITFDGSLCASRLTDGSLLLKIVYSPHETPDFRTNNFIPHYETKAGKFPIAPEDITVPDTPCYPIFTTVYLLDGMLNVKASHTLMGVSSAEYVTKDTVYLVSTTHDLRRENGEIVTMEGKYRVRESTSTVVAIGYSKDALVKKGSVSVKGEVKDQYSLDEYDGILRVAATTTETRLTYQGGKYTATVSTDRNASLYCISLDRFEVVASVENFAPKGESVRSARFDGTKAYICTAVEFTDPVFFFDLSDLANITYSDTGAIEGYSSSLIELDGGYLLGVGYESIRNTMKIEIYKEIDGKVESVSKFVKEGVWFSEDYKSYYIDREAAIFGIGIKDYTQPTNLCHYLVFSLDGGVLTLVHDFDMGNDVGIPDQMRGFADEGIFYVFTPSAQVFTKAFPQ